MSVRVVAWAGTRGDGGELLRALPVVLACATCLHDAQLARRLLPTVLDVRTHPCAARLCCCLLPVQLYAHSFTVLLPTGVLYAMYAHSCDAHAYGVCLTRVLHTRMVRTSLVCIVCMRIQRCIRMVCSRQLLAAASSIPLPADEAEKEAIHARHEKDLARDWVRFESVPHSSV